MGYNKDLNYQDEIDKKVAAGDYAGAAVLEKGRNEKITGEGLNYSPTNMYADFLPTNDQPSQMPKYQSQYSPAMTNILNQIQGYGTFDPSKDKMLQDMLAASTDYYTKQGKRAMQDTVGQVAARTGGLASSWAASAGNQQYNNYMDLAADKSVSLENEAFDRFQGGKDDLFGMMSMYQGLDSADYGKYRDTVSDTQWGMQYDDSQDQQALDNLRYDQQYGDNRDDANFSKAQNLLSMGFSTADIAQALGISQEQADAYAYKINNPKKTGGGSPVADKTSDDLYQDMKDSGNPEIYLYEHYGEYGLKSTGLPAILKAFQNWATTYTGPKELEKGTNAWTAYSWAQNALNKGANPDEVLSFLEAQVAGGDITEDEKNELMQNLEF